MFANDWLDRLQRKYGRYAIHNLMNIIVGGMGIVFVLDAFSRWNLSGLLHFSLPAIRMGQIWRLITFVFVPPNASMITACCAGIPAQAAAPAASSAPFPEK